jgi:hypothetical protein
MSKPDSYISVWFDDTSDEHGWIVDRCDEDDNSTTVKFYEVELDEDDEDYDDEYSEAEEKARAFAKRYAEKTGLPIR